MSAVARWLARIVWWGMLHLMRRPRMRRMRKFWLRIVPKSTAERMIKQDRFARRHAVTVLTFSFTLLMGSITVTGCYFLALAFVNSGLFGVR